MKPPGIPANDVPLEADRPGLLVDIHGTTWRWNCGWRRWSRPDASSPKGTYAPSPILGHMDFQRHIKLAAPSDLQRSSTFKYSRPWGPWRRANVDHVYHELFGNGKLLITDGLHAVVLFNDGLKREVQLDLLTDAAKLFPEKRVAPLRKPRNVSQLKVEFALGTPEWDNWMKDLL